MKNHNMVISDGPTMVKPALFRTPMNVYFAGKKLIKKCRGNGAKVSALLDSMRASSPTRRASSNARDRIGSLKLHHPSALSMFEEIAAEAFKGKEIVIFLDYDGTLSPIVDDPDRAFMSDEMRQTVKDIAEFFPTAIVSGRCRAKVYSFVKLSELYYAGSHGMDIMGPSKGRNQQRKGTQTVLCQPAREFLPVIDEVRKSLMEKIKHIPGAKVENNEFCLSVHYRCVHEARWGEVDDRVRRVMMDYPQLKLTQGRKVLEVRPNIKWDKGNAVEFLLESLGYAADSDNVLPVYIGDDRTDEDAFKVLRNRGKGLGILVSKTPKETNASYTLQEPLEVMYFLKRVVEWKKKMKKCNTW